MPPSLNLPRSTPEAQGVRSEGLLALVEALDRAIDEPHSVMVIRRGQVVAEGWWEPYSPERRHMLFSLTKSFMSAAVGLAVAEGKLSYDDPVVKFFPGVAPNRPSRFLAGLTVRHLLTMSTGRLTDSMTECGRDPAGDWVRGFFRNPWLQKPGTPFVYDTGASHVAGAIVQKVTGQDLRDYLMPRLFVPLGIETPVWETDPTGGRTGGFGLSLTTEDVAKFGQLLLQKGVWKGQEVLPADWVALATSRQVVNDRYSPSTNPDWRLGYGFQFWQGRHGSFRGDGAFGQFCVVLPEHETVLAVTAAVGDSQALLDLAWKHLLPALSEGVLAPRLEENASLGRRLATLRRPLPSGEPTSPLEPTIATRKFTMEGNDWSVKELLFAFEGNHLVWTVTDGRGTHRLEAGRGQWHEAASDLFPSLTVTGPRAASPLTPVVSAFVWTGPRTLTLLARVIETPYVYRFSMVFEGNLVRIQALMNVNMGPRELPKLVGVGRRI